MRNYREVLRRIVIYFLLFIVGLHAAWALALAGLRVVNPPTTGVQMQPGIEALFKSTPYRKRCTFVPLLRIFPEMRHAVISAEDGGFYWAVNRQVCLRDTLRAFRGYM